jgi:hypothetical protein
MPVSIECKQRARDFGFGGGALALTGVSCLAINHYFKRPLWANWGWQVAGSLGVGAGAFTLSWKVIPWNDCKKEAASAPQRPSKPNKATLTALLEQWSVTREAVVKRALYGLTHQREYRAWDENQWKSMAAVIGKDKTELAGKLLICWHPESFQRLAPHLDSAHKELINRLWPEDLPKANKSV